MNRRILAWLLTLIVGCASEETYETDDSDDAGVALVPKVTEASRVDAGLDAALPKEDAALKPWPDAATALDAATARDARADAEEPIESFAAIYSDILQPKCATAYCHVATNRGGLVMTPRSEAYRRLYNQPGGAMERDPYSLCKESGLMRVVPGSPESSLLIQKLAPPDGVVPCGKSMPEFKAALPDAEIARIRRWIAQGAANN